MEIKYFYLFIVIKGDKTRRAYFLTLNYYVKELNLIVLVLIAIIPLRRNGYTFVLKNCFRNTPDGSAFYIAAKKNTVRKFDPVTKSAEKHFNRSKNWNNVCYLLVILNAFSKNM